MSMNVVSLNSVVATGKILAVSTVADKPVAAQSATVATASKTAITGASSRDAGVALKSAALFSSVSASAVSASVEPADEGALSAVRASTVQTAVVRPTAIAAAAEVEVPVRSSLPAEEVAPSAKLVAQPVLTSVGADAQGSTTSKPASGGTVTVIPDDRQTAKADTATKTAAVSAGKPVAATTSVAASSPPPAKVAVSTVARDRASALAAQGRAAHDDVSSLLSSILSGTKTGAENVLESTEKTFRAIVSGLNGGAAQAAPAPKPPGAVASAPKPTDAVHPALRAYREHAQAA